MTPPASSSLHLGRGLRILRVQMVQRSGEIDEYDFSGVATTILTGPRNSSKTTTLKVIDFCLGGGGSVARKLGTAIDEKYVLLSVDIAINGQLHRMTRDFEFGRRDRVLIDDSIDRTTNEMSEWLLRELGWPQLLIPKGVNAGTASQQTPLTFRSVLRHIYRREDSWIEFAKKEEEFLRRAVISLMLGLAPSRYETAEYALGQAQRKLASAEAVYRDVLTSTEEAVRALVTRLGLPPVAGEDSLGNVRAELERHLSMTRAEKEALTQAAEDSTRAAPGLDPTVPQQLEDAATAAAVAAEQVSALRQVIDEHQRSQLQVQADIERLDRLIDAVDLFDDIPVRVCPACEQSIEPHNSQVGGTCYLCTQPVSGDGRKRRAGREQRALTAEMDDLADAIGRAQANLDEVKQVETRASAERTQLAARLHDERVTHLAPFMAALEDISTEIGKAEQQLAALPALEAILARRADAKNGVDEANVEVERLTKLAEADAQLANRAAEHCGALADRMNEFLSFFGGRGWIDELVTISSDELTFYVGTRPWNQKLGAEAAVLFFLAYSYALLHIDVDLGTRACPPGVLLLDNPYQQGLPPGTVVEAINRIAAAAETHGTQVILTQATTARNISAPHTEIVMPREYA
ncbi:hypothetical protein [Amycolatopsis pigmentata]|uniref:AAA domain-containing protein n=1 Tax=Amycolatopsis pigmentata TaxID=450801 RepID=A0ABW5FQ55_9PSEU